MLDQAPRNDLRHDLVGIADAHPATGAERGGMSFSGGKEIVGRERRTLAEAQRRTRTKKPISLECSDWRRRLIKSDAGFPAIDGFGPVGQEVVKTSTRCNAFASGFPSFGSHSKAAQRAQAHSALRDASAQFGMIASITD